MIKKVNLDQAGLGMFLGSTEEHIMRALWAGPKTLQEIHMWIIKHRNPQQGYSAVNTVLARLIEKEYVSKHTDLGQHAVYKADTLGEKDFVLQCLRHVCLCLDIWYPHVFACAYDIVFNECNQAADSIPRFIPPREDV